MAEKDQSPLMKGLLAHKVSATIADVDHYRIRGGLAVESDYIVSVEPTEESEESFEPFAMSKTFSSFRSYANQLKKTSDIYTSKNAEDGATLPREAVKTAKFCELVHHLINSQKTSYLGKVNYMYVQVLAKKRSQILNDILEATCTYFPADPGVHPLLATVAETVEAFFLTDHIDEAHHLRRNLDLTKGPAEVTQTPKKKKEDDEANPLQAFLNQFSPVMPSVPGKDALRRLPVVVPITRRTRRSEIQRGEEERELEEVGGEAKLMLDDERPTIELVPSYSRPIPVVRSRGTKIGNFFDNNPLVFLVIAIIAIYIIHIASFSRIAIDGDIALLIIFASFCLGLHTPRPMVGGFDRPASMKGFVRNKDPAGRKLLRRSMSATPKMMQGSTPTHLEMHVDLANDEGDDEAMMGSPFPRFPLGAKLGSHTNCWSEPDPSTFQVRGSNYLKDRKKVASSDYLFPARGLDLFLTDACPENVGRNSGVFGGQLRDVPTFIINFRLPWGVLLAYYEIPATYIPFIRACYEPDFDKNSLPSLASMSPGERTACRFLMNDMSRKNKTLKIVPIVASGPWVVRQAVGGKPAIIGNKLPVNYVYQPAEGKKALYLEADLDIAASSAARSILSLVKSYTQIVTVDLGFVVQGNETDELPEQMLVATRIHGIEPLTAPQLPPMSDHLFIDTSPSTDDDDSLQ